MYEMYVATTDAAIIRTSGLLAPPKLLSGAVSVTTYNDNGIVSLIVSSDQHYHARSVCSGS